VAVHAEKAPRSLAQKAEMLVLGILAEDCVLVKAQYLGGGTTGQKHLAVVRPVVAEPSAQLDP
jgi:hypothetical protein